MTYEKDRIISNVIAASARAAPPATAPAASAAAAEKARCAAILRSTAAEGRRGLAQHLALRTDMQAETAIAVLSAAPKETAQAAAAAQDNGWDSIVASLNASVRR